MDGDRFQFEYAYLYLPGLVWTGPKAILSSLEEMAPAVSDSGPRANDLLERFLKCKTVIGLIVASEVLGELACLNRSLQKQSEMVGGMQAAVAYVTSSL